MAYVQQNEMAGLGFSIRRAVSKVAKKVVRTPIKLTKKVIKAPIKLAKKSIQIQKKIIKKSAKPIAKVALAPIALGVKFAGETAKMGASYMMPAPAPIAEPTYPDFAPSLPVQQPVSYAAPVYQQPVSYAAPVYQQPVSYAAPVYQQPVSYAAPAYQPANYAVDEPSIYSEDYDMNDLERPMTDEQIRQYIEAQENAGDTVDGLSGFMDKLKSVVKKAAVVVATVKGGPVAGRKVYDALLAKKGSPPEQAAVVYESGNQAVSQGIPRAVGEKAAKSFFTGKNIAIGGVAIIGLGLLTFLALRKR